MIRNKCGGKIEEDCRNCENESEQKDKTNIKFLLGAVATCKEEIADLKKRINKLEQIPVNFF
jgi:hypothetical protein